MIDFHTMHISFVETGRVQWGDEACGVQWRGDLRVALYGQREAGAVGGQFVGVLVAAHQCEGQDCLCRG